MQAFFSCFSCGEKTSTIVTPQPISASKVTPLEEEQPSFRLIQQFQDNKSRSATTITFRTTDTAPSSVEDQASYIRKKIQQMRKKDLPERKAMESEFIRQNLAKSTVVYLVEKEWSELYTAFLKNLQVKDLRSINNSRLLNSRGCLLSDVKEKQDYFIINDRVWKFVQLMYGGGPAIKQDLYFPVLPLSNKKQEIPMIGMVNPLNLCYAIATIQCLLSAQHLAHFLFKKQYDDSKKKMAYHTLMTKLTKTMMQATGNKVEVKELASILDSKFSSFEQHDAHQLMLHMINQLQEEGKGELIKEEGQAKDPESAYSVYMRNNRSIIDRLFVGQVETVVSCSRCEQISANYHTFIDIELELADIQLQNCLKKHFSIEKLEDYQCEKCRKRTRATKQYQVTKTPNYLILTLKKFGQSGRKIEERVKYPLELDIKKICKGHSGDTKYSLQSILVHKGTKSTKGHYYCYTRRNRKTWHYASDDLIKEIEQNEVTGRDAYILFYERSSNK